MTAAVVWLLSAWVTLTPPVAIVIGRAIHLRDQS